jgi:hypothetical protein
MEHADFAGANRIPLVGRRTFLQDAANRLRQGGIHLLFFDGERGIGKTTLIQAILDESASERQDRDQFSRYVAGSIIELERAGSRTPQGIIRRIIEVLGPQYFTETRGCLETQEQVQPRAGQGMAYVEGQQAALQQFLAELATLAREGVVLAFDSAEMLDSEPSASRLDEIPDLRMSEWLFESCLSELQGNILILFGGSLSGIIERMDSLVERNPNIHFQHSILPPFSQEETKEYLEAVARLESERDDPDAAARLSEFSKERGDIVHFLTEGKPVILSLVADIVAHGWLLPSAFGRTLQELQAQGIERWRPDVERALVSRIQESPTFIGEAIRTLAWLRKGATTKLLAWLMELSTPDGDLRTDTAEDLLTQVAQLSLVKAWPGKERVFLHDDIYRLLERYVLRECSAGEKAHFYRAVVQYYDAQEDVLRSLEAQAAAAHPSFSARLNHLHAERAYYHQFLSPELNPSSRPR